MPPSDKFIVVDALTIVTLLVDDPTNQNISLFEGVFESGVVVTTSSTRKSTQDYDGMVWDRFNLSRIKIVKRDINLSKMVATIRAECTKNGLDVSDRGYSPKLDLLACARMHGGTIVSVDDNIDSPLSLASLARRFGVNFQTLRH